ncbi:MAG: protein-disulfide reductase DsbD N-terminal domain-containing protein [Acidobacteriaceae bacterium]
MRVFCATLLLAASLAPAQRLPWQTTKRPQDVRYLFPEQVSVAAGKDAVIELHFRINPGMHINSHTPSEKGLIATKLNLVNVSGVKLGAMEFPAGSEYSLAALPDEKLSVYTGDFVVRAHVKAAAGQHLLQGSLRYQACDVNACYPPREAAIAVSVVAR